MLHGAIQKIKVAWFFMDHDVVPLTIAKLSSTLKT